MGLLGGGGDVRGFRAFHLGPYDCKYAEPSDDLSCCTSQGIQSNQSVQPIGGRLQFYTNVEYRYYSDLGYGFVVFHDMGRVWENIDDISFAGLQHAIGAGLRYKSTIGPIRLDVARRVFVDPVFAEEPKWTVHVDISESF